MTKPKLLLIGSCGFVLSNLVRKIIYSKADFDLISIDRVNNQKNLYNIYANKGHKFYIGDVTDSHLVNLIFDIEKPDLVVHGAENKDPDCLQNNVMATQAIVQACQKFGVQKLVYLSSMDKVLGTGNAYSASKVASEVIIENLLSAQTKLSYSILKFPDLFGPRQTIGTTIHLNLVSFLIWQLLHAGKGTLFDQGQTLREWLSVEDAGAAVLNALTNSETDNQTYQISSGYEFTDLEIFYELIKNLELPEVKPTFIASSPEDLLKKISTPTQLKDLPNWKPSGKPKLALAQTCNWYSNNQWYLK